jgi:hypothetical protein
VTRTVSIDAPYGKVFSFLLEPYNLPDWAIVDITEVLPGEGGWWQVRTLAGNAMLRIRSNFNFGVLDYEFEFLDARWSIPSRLLAREDRCEYVLTLFAPSLLVSNLFEHQIVLIDQKLARLKALMEGDEPCY